jgi:DNA-binding sugar fermentation-stimulating protein
MSLKTNEWQVMFMENSESIKKFTSAPDIVRAFAHALTRFSSNGIDLHFMNSSESLLKCKDAEDTRED